MIYIERERETHVVLVLLLSGPLGALEDVFDALIQAHSALLLGGEGDLCSIYPIIEGFLLLLSFPFGSIVAVHGVGTWTSLLLPHGFIADILLSGRR